MILPDGARVPSMKLCTDNPRSAQEWFSCARGWRSDLPERLPEEFRAIAQRLLPAAPAATASIDLPDPWRSAVFVEHADRSQFDVLVSALRSGLVIPHGVLCLAGSGEGFHGQGARAWAAVRGNMHLSVCLSSVCDLNDIVTGLTVLPAVSLVQALDSIPGLENRAGIKWINDIVVGGSKLAGYIVHTQSLAGGGTIAIIGIGLNVEAVPPVAPTAFVPSVTALRYHLSDPRACSRADVLRRLLWLLAWNHEKLVGGRAPELLDFYRERSVVIGRRVEVYADRLELILAGGGRPVFGGRLAMESAAGSPA
jgi:biotin-(acetyl-CoA carboxylase) ligase